MLPILTFTPLYVLAMEKCYEQHKESVADTTYIRELIEQNPHLALCIKRAAFSKICGTLSPGDFDRSVEKEGLPANFIIYGPDAIRYASRNKQKTHTRLKIASTCPLYEAIQAGNEPLVRHLIDKHKSNEHHGWGHWADESLAVIAIRNAALYYHNEEQHATRLRIAKKMADHIFPHEIALLLIESENKMMRDASDSALFDAITATCDLASLRHLTIQKLTTPIISRFEKLPAHRKILESLVKDHKPDGPFDIVHATTVSIKHTRKGEKRIQLACPLSNAICDGSMCAVQRFADLGHCNLEWTNHKHKSLTMIALEKAVYPPDADSGEIKKERFAIAQYMLQKSPPTPVEWARYLVQLIHQRKFALLRLCCNEKALKKNEQFPFIAYLLMKADASDVCLTALQALIKRGASCEAPCLYRNNKWMTPLEIALKRELKIGKCAQEIQNALASKMQHP